MGGKEAECTRGAEMGVSVLGLRDSNYLLCSKALGVVLNPAYKESSNIIPASDSRSTSHSGPAPALRMKKLGGREAK